MCDVEERTAEEGTYDGTYVLMLVLKKRNGKTVTRVLRRTGSPEVIRTSSVELDELNSQLTAHLWKIKN